MKVTGVFAPIATNFDESGGLDLCAYADNAKRLGGSRLAGLVALGTNGEFVSLSCEEKLSLIRETRKVLPASKLVIAGVGHESTAATVRFTRDAASEGADVALLLNPTYHKRDLGPDALEKFFLDVADASPIPVMIYNMPVNSGINIPSALTIKLSQHENIVGIKDSGGNIVQIAEIIAGTAPDFSVFAGSGSYLFATSMLGGVGGTLAVANIAPNFCADLHDSCASGEVDRAREMQLDLLPLNAAVTTRFGIGGLKAALDCVGMHGGNPRLPILPAKGPDREEIAAIVERLRAKYGYL